MLNLVTDWGSICQVFPLYSEFPHHHYRGLFGRKSLHAGHIKEHSDALPPRRESICINYFGLFCMGDLYILHYLYIYSVFYKLNQKDGKIKSKGSESSNRNSLLFIPYNTPISSGSDKIWVKLQLCAGYRGGRKRGKEKGGREIRAWERFQLLTKALANTTEKWSEF